ncbi:SGNH/GDSL hydrolase family protein [Ciceribacter sp. L1K22]|uniref:SGNH/GDSL hydrolase family protein n=1 Tax=Ciceribacter sp. L1K22 TaxID=2820275 RepID=UPI001ABEB51E|nr:SGNH/GDSL hydrolase family protein [Ciceribacter sp. L1K22]MBO3761555.1 SGNH/GDSL hydrolase family protein [Ciceribacter sp. L1K22]
MVEDPIGTYDPLLGNDGPRAGHPYYRGGYKIWPGAEEVANAVFRILCIGNSTSLWPASAWSLELGKKLRRYGHSVAIYNGAGKGHSSSQELLRVIRDAPAIKPDLIISLSGICDIGYLVNAKGYPFLHKYSRKAMEYLKRSDIVSDISHGYPDSAGPAEVWCRNQRLANVVSAELGIKHIVLLQPVQGIGSYPATAEELEFLDQKSRVVLRAADVPYITAVRDFYAEVRDIMAREPEKYKHIVDFTSIFDNVPGAYRDHRHQSQLGVEHIATQVEKLISPILSELASENRQAGA